MLKRLLPLLLFLAPIAAGQGIPFQFEPPAPGAQFSVCLYPPSGYPCSNKQPIFTDAALSVPLVQPVTLGPTGRLTFFVAGGTYMLQVQNGGAQYPTQKIIYVGGGGAGGSPGGAPQDIQCQSPGGGSFANCSSTTVNMKGDPIFYGPNPTVDARSSGLRALDRTSIPLTTGITGNISASSANLTLSTTSCPSQAITQCFVNGDGIVVYGAGAACGLSTPGAPTVTPSVDKGFVGTELETAAAAGATAYQYQIVAVDAVHGCYSAPSVAGATATGNSTLGLTTIPLTSCSRTNNIATCTTTSAHTLAAGALILVYGTTDDQNFGTWIIVDTVPDNTHFTYTNGIDLSNNGLPLVPPVTSGNTGASATGGNIYYFAPNHLSWSTVSGATEYCIYGRVSGTTNWIGCSRPEGPALGSSAFVDNTYDDYGSPMEDNKTRPAWLPATLPGAASNQWLSTTISSGGGTINLVLNATATNTVAAAIVRHDNAPNITAAITAATSVAGFTQASISLPLSTAGANYVYDVNTWLSIPASVTLNLSGTRLWLNATLQLHNNDYLIGSNYLPSASVGAFAQSGGGGAFINEASPGLYGDAFRYNFRQIVLVGNAANGVIGGVFDAVNPFTMEDVTLVSSTSVNGMVDIPLILRGAAGGPNQSFTGNTSFSNYFRNVYISGGGTSTANNGITITTNAPGLLCDGCGLTRIDNLQLNNGHGLAFIGTSAMLNSGRIQGSAMPVLSALGTNLFGTGGTYKIMDFEQDTSDAPLGFNGTGGASVGGIAIANLDLERAGCPQNNRPLVSGHQWQRITNKGNSCTLTGQNHEVFTETTIDKIAPFGLVSSGAYPGGSVRLSTFAHFPGNQRLFWDFSPTAAAVNATVASGGSIVQPHSFYFYISPVGFDGGIGLRSVASPACVTSSGNQTCNLTWTAVPGAASYNIAFSEDTSTGICTVTTVPATTLSTSITTTPGGQPCLAGDGASGPTYLSRSEVATPSYRLTGGTSSFSGIMTNQPTGVAAPLTTQSGNRTYIFPDVNGFVPVTGYQPTAFDKCNRADGAIGSNWTTEIGTFNCASNLIKGNLSTDNTMYWTAYPLNGVINQGQFAEAQMTTLGARSGPGVYMDAVSGNGYACTETSAALNIARFLNGVPNTNVGTAAITGVNGDIVRLEVRPGASPNLLCYLNGVLTTTATDTLVTSGSPGLDIFNTTVRVSNWNGGTLHPIAQLDQEQMWPAFQHYNGGVIASNYSSSTLPTSTLATCFNGPNGTLTNNGTCQALAAPCGVFLSVQYNNSGVCAGVGPSTAPDNTPRYLTWTSVGGVGQPPQASLLGIVRRDSNCPSNSDAITSADRGRHITENDASTCNVTLPQAGTGAGTQPDFSGSFTFKICDVGAGNISITSTVSLINNSASPYVLGTGQCGFFTTNNTDWFSDLSLNTAITTITNSDGTLTITNPSGPSTQINVNSIPNNKLTNSTITVDGNSVALGGSVSANDRISMTAEGVTGVTTNKLVCYTGAPATAITCSAGTVTGIKGIATNTTIGGTAVIQTIGDINCAFDASATVSGHYVGQSSTTAGDCTDLSTSNFLTAFLLGQVVGVVKATTAGSTNALVTLFTSSEINGKGVTQTVASGTSAMGTSAITSGACATVVTTSATGTATTDTLIYTPNTDPTAVTGYGPSASGSLYIWAYPTSNNVNFKVCNNTAGSITPSALTLNWRVTR